MASIQEGLAIVDEKLTYTNVIENLDLDEDSVLSEYVMTEELDAFLLKKSNMALVSKSEVAELVTSVEGQAPSSLDGSDLSIRPEELSGSILENLPVSPSLGIDDSVGRDLVGYVNANKEKLVKKTPDECVLEKPLVRIESKTANAKPSPATGSQLYSLIRIALLALLVSGGLHTRLQLSWSLSSCGESCGEKASMGEAESVLENEKNAYEFFEAMALPQSSTEELASIGDEMNALSVIPTLDKPESGWGSLFTHLLALALSMCSVTFLTSEQLEEDKSTENRYRKVNRSRVEAIRHILIECKKSLRRNGRRSRKESELENYNMTSYERLSIEDLQKILMLLGQPVKGDKQRLIKTIIIEYSRQLTFLTKAEIVELLEFHNMRMHSKKRKVEMVKTLAEAAF